MSRICRPWPMPCSGDRLAYRLGFERRKAAFHRALPQAAGPPHRARAAVIGHAKKAPPAGALAALARVMRQGVLKCRPLTIEGRRIPSGRKGRLRFSREFALSRNGYGNRRPCLHNSNIIKATGGAGGIRTLDTLLTYTHFPGERLRPLGHRSACTGGGVLAAHFRFCKAAAE